MVQASPKNSEWLARKQLIDQKLQDASWRVVPFDSTKSLIDYEGCAVEEYPTASGPADYALCTDGRMVGVVEAKKLTLGPQNVLTQAERYSRGVLNSGFDFGEFRVPFLYSTNGGSNLVSMIFAIIEVAREPQLVSIPSMRSKNSLTRISRVRLSNSSTCRTIIPAFWPAHTRWTQTPKLKRR